VFSLRNIATNSDIDAISSWIGSVSGLLILVVPKRTGGKLLPSETSWLFGDNAQGHRFVLSVPPTAHELADTMPVFVAEIKRGHFRAAQAFKKSATNTARAGSATLLANF
jgi:hypothetical protein